MSLALFNAGAIEVLLDANNQPFIHRAQYGRFLGLSNICMSIPEDMKRDQIARSQFEKGVNLIYPLGKLKNPHDMFISVELALYIAMRSDKEKAKVARVYLLKDIIPRGFNKIIEEKQLTITNRNKTIEERFIVRRVKKE